MNEHKQYIRGTNENDINMSELMGELLGLMTCARNAGLVSLEIQLEQLQKNLLRNKVNKKIIRATQDKMLKIQKELQKSR